MGRAEAEPGLGDAPTACLRHGQRDAEVGDERLSLSTQEDITGLDVPVDDAVAVGVVECARHLLGDYDRVLDAQLLLSVQSFPERLPLHMRHDVEEESIRLARIEERQDVRVLQIGRRLDLGQEALGTDHRGQFGLQDLEGHFAVVLDILGQVDGRHAAFAELTLNGVAAL